MADIPMKSFNALRLIVTLLITALFLVSLYADLNLSALIQSSPQPVTFSQMRALVTPQDADAKEALNQALANPYYPAKWQTEDMVSVEKIRTWVASHISYVFDENAHGVPDYWQTPSETLNLGTGDCEDLSILLVSLLRAYGASDDQVYVAVGSDPNDNWHAYVIERYSFGIWRILDAEYPRDASFVESLADETYKTSYCFNDMRSFKGFPSYPGGYVVPGIPVTIGVSPVNTIIQFPGGANPSAPRTTTIIYDPSFDEIKQSMGILWLPAYLPDGYKLFDTTLYNGNWVYFTYRKIGGPGLEIWEYPYSASFSVPEDVVKEVTVNGNKAYLVYGYWAVQGTSPTYTTVWNNKLFLKLYFSLDGCFITIQGTWVDSWDPQELIKIAESLQPY
jgi:predicted transglutaminase-like cysteine proteinase